MDANKLWMILVGIRILSVLVPQSGYIHPDEFFQSTEVIAGDVLDVKHERTWEFTWKDPIRSILLPYVMFGPVLFLLRLLNLATPYFVLVLPRLVVTAASIIVDRCVFLLCRKHNADGYTSLLLYATSYVSWTYMTHTFSNTIEAILFAVLLVTTSGACEEKKTYRRRKIMSQSASSHDTVILAAIITVGTFNRPTFLIFSFVPMLRWLWNLVNSEWKMPNRMHAFISHITALSVTSLMISVVFVLVDTIYYRYESVRHIPKDLQNCVFDNSKLECFGKMYTSYLPSVVVSPLNFLSYNSQSSNLSQHGSHPWFFHTVFSLPLLFGPAVVFVMWRVLKNILNVFLGGSLKVNSDFHLDDVNVVSCFLFPLVMLSCVSHQEPRFLLPLVPLGFIIATKSISSFKSKRRWMLSTTFIKFWIFNALAFLIVGFLHQGGIVPGISKLQDKVKAIKGESHVVFYHTYSAPEHLFLHPEDSSADLFVYNLAGASFEKLEKTMEKIRTSAESKKGDEWIGIWVVAPKTVIADVKKLNIKFGNVNKYCHLSFEDPPRALGWLKGELPWSEFVSEFSLVVAEVKSWKVFSDSEKTKKKDSA